MKPILFLLVFVISFSLQAQRVIDVGKTDADPTRGLFYVVGGEPFSLAKYIRIVDGSPYFNENWMWGTLIMPSGRRYDSLQLKLDLISNELHYLDKSGSDFIASSAISEVWLTDSVSGEQSRFVHASAVAVSAPPADGWYKLLASGFANLFISYHKVISEIMPYGAATAEQTIKTSPEYYISCRDVFTHIKKLPELADLFTDKYSDIKKYINNYHLSGKSAADYIKVVSYYNGLHTK